MADCTGGKECEDLPKEDGFAFIHEEKLLPWGSCANVLVTLAHLGTKAGMIALFTLFVQKHLIKGLTMGAVKG